MNDAAATTIDVATNDQDGEPDDPSGPTHWPAGDVAPCACPFCGHIDEHQVANVRNWHVHARDGACSVCFADYVVVPKQGKLFAEKLARDAHTYLIRHRYDIGDQGVTIQAMHGFDPRRAAIYMQFKAEEWFGEEKAITNLGIAAALVSFYGCKHAARNGRGEEIDMHADREMMCGKSEVLLADASLQRDGLKEFLISHL